MSKRRKFKCWQCSRKYTLYREINKEQKLFVACPYCGAEAVVDLDPFRKEVKEVFRSENNSNQDLGLELQLPETIPTRQPQETDRGDG